MTDESAFLRAVCDSPEDDLPRLVYADWLEENAVVRRCPACSGKGDGFVYSPPGRGKIHVGRCINCEGSGHISDGRRERAEFIRVGCKSAEIESRIRVGGPLPGGREEIAECEHLRRRERELLEEHGFTWAVASLPRMQPTAVESGGLIGPGFCGWDFRRGFVESITCPARTFLEHCHAIRNACPLREATLTGGVDPEWFRGRAMREGGRREVIRLCKGGSKLGIVAAVYDAHGGRRSEWGRKLFLDLLHAEFRWVSFRLTDPVTVQNGQARGGSVFPAGREESEEVCQFVRENPGDFGVEVNGREWVTCEDYSDGRPSMAMICRCSNRGISVASLTRPERINPAWQVELRQHQVQIREFVYRFLIGQCVDCRTVHHTTPTRQYAPTSPAYR